VGFQAKGFATAILAVVLAFAASWAGVIVLLVLSVTSPGSRLAEGLLLVWAVLAAGCLVGFAIGRLSLDEFFSAWRWRIVLAPTLPLILAGVGFMRLTSPRRQRRAVRRWDQTRIRRDW
jgi:hypothetical protein